MVHKIALSEEHNTGGLSALTERRVHVKERNVTNGLQLFLVWVGNLLKNSNIKENKNLRNK
jgi:hypothetical protein